MAASLFPSRSQTTVSMLQNVFLTLLFLFLLLALESRLTKNDRKNKVFLISSTLKISPDILLSESFYRSIKQRAVNCCRVLKKIDLLSIARFIDKPLQRYVNAKNYQLGAFFTRFDGLSLQQ